jgi:amino acid permease
MIFDIILELTIFVVLIYIVYQLFKKEDSDIKKIRKMKLDVEKEERRSEILRDAISLLKNIRKKYGGKTSQNLEENLDENLKKQGIFQKKEEK